MGKGPHSVPANLVHLWKCEVLIAKLPCLHYVCNKSCNCLPSFYAPTTSTITSREATAASAGTALITAAALIQALRH